MEQSLAAELVASMDEPDGTGTAHLSAGKADVSIRRADSPSRSA
jgi:hypothetical protein